MCAREIEGDQPGIASESGYGRFGLGRECVGIG